ncbi:hypothetical protein KGF56_003008 [Candida oxycetoniae]|uniref:CID domain-containing protein n=1 Tax=Candida oxycetoniae TaxID=497107 RepID=A0AAI9SWH5_9ASCO|nr:uncharacterized protein KGF56_003008 [Candida oxycetoniae]KAI3404247.2 hypothetical protein KGF56_003008 [Candida oxycetoniae]
MVDILTEYKGKLHELTFNSQPIITELTQIAKQHLELADQIIDLITERIYQTIPEQKLYALYVLDDICKVVGNPYNILIGDEIYNIYIHVFQLNNETIRDKLVRLFETWKVSTLRNSKILIFPKDQLAKIDQFLKKAGYPKKTPSFAVDSPRVSQAHGVGVGVGVGGLPPKPGVSIQQSLINDIDQLIPVFEKQLALNTRDTKLQDRFKALSKLKVLLSSEEMKPAELEAIKSHIVNIQVQVQTQTTASAAAGSGSPQKPQPQPQPQPSIPKVNPAFGLFNDLILSGLVKKEQEPIPGSKPVYTLMFPEVKYSADQHKDDDINNLEDILLQSSSIQRSEYDKLKFVELLNVSKKTSSGDLQHFINNNKPSASLVNLLYEAKPSKCSICGKRFTTDYEGTNNKRLHLDWHFRINKKLSAKGGANIQSRNWYLDDYDWVKFDEDSLSELGTVQKETGIGLTAATTATAITAAGSTPFTGTATEQAPQVTYVPVPANDTNMNNRCLICREQVKAKYNDEIGEWVWYDCMKQPGEKNQRRIVHVSCYNDRKRAAEMDLLNSNVKREKI